MATIYRLSGWFSKEKVGGNRQLLALTKTLHKLRALTKTLHKLSEDGFRFTIGFLNEVKKTPQLQKNLINHAGEILKEKEKDPCFMGFLPFELMEKLNEKLSTTIDLRYGVFCLDSENILISRSGKPYVAADPKN